jgi:putative nucleotidyltransferase with HDIG domain
MIPPVSGTDGNSRLYPFWGRMQERLAVFSRFWPFHGLGPLRTYLLFLCLTSLGLAAWLLYSEAGLVSVWATAALAVIAAVAERGRVQLGPVEASVSLLATVFAAVLFGPLAAMLIAAASMSGDFGRPFMRWAVYTSSRATTGALTGMVAVATLSVAPEGFGGITLACAAAAITAEVLDVVFTSVTLRLRSRARAKDVLRTAGPAVIASLPLYAPIVALLAFAYEEVSPWTLPLFFVPALAAQRLFALYEHQRGLTEDLIGANERLQRANLSFATALVATLDARDRYTAGHSAAVAIYARDIAERMALPQEQVNIAHLCGLVHDIGKIGLPPGLLEKPGALTLEERRMMERHSEIGERILGKVSDYSEIAKIVRHHHERVDGQGYPDGFAGEEIPMISRIIAVADAYNAMTSDRPYRDAMPSRVARLRLAQAVEGQFDTTVVAAFEAILAGASEEYRSGARTDFNLDAQEHEAPRLAAVAAV